MSDDTEHSSSFGSIPKDVKNIIFRFFTTEDLFTLQLVCAEWSRLVWDSQESAILPSTIMPFSSFPKLRRLKHLQFGSSSAGRFGSSDFALGRPFLIDLLEHVPSFENLQSLTIRHSTTIPASLHLFLVNAFGFGSKAPGTLKNLTYLSLGMQLDGPILSLPTALGVLMNAIVDSCPKLTYLELPFPKVTTTRVADPLFEPATRLQHLETFVIPSASQLADWSILRSLKHLKKLNVVNFVDFIPHEKQLDHWRKKRLAFVPVYSCNRFILQRKQTDSLLRFLDLYHQEGCMTRENVLDFIDPTRTPETALTHPAVIQAAGKLALIEIDHRFASLLPQHAHVSLSYADALVDLLLAPYMRSGSTKCSASSLPLSFLVAIRRNMVTLCQHPGSANGSSALLQSLVSRLSGAFTSAELLSLCCSSGWTQHALVILNNAKPENYSELILFEEDSLFQEPLVSVCGRYDGLCEDVLDALLPLYASALVARPDAVQRVVAAAKTRISGRSLVSLIRSGLVTYVSDIDPEVMSRILVLPREEFLLITSIMTPEYARMVELPPLIDDESIDRAIELCFRVTIQSFEGIVSDPEATLSSFERLIKRYCEQSGESIYDLRDCEQWDESSYDSMTSLLIEAVDARRPDFVQCLLDNGADPNVIVSGRTALVAAASTSGNSNVIRTLMKAGADVNLSPENNEPPLLIAARTKNFEYLRVLIKEYGADCKQKGHEGYSVFCFPEVMHYLCAGSQDDDRPLLSYISPDSFLDVNLGVPFLIHVLSVASPPLDQILSCRSDWNLFVRHPVSKLSFLQRLAETWRLGNAIVVSEYIKRHDSHLCSAFLPVLASGLARDLPRRDFLDFLDFCSLLGDKFDINNNDHGRLSRTALHEAAAAHDVEVIQRLLNLGADPSIVDAYNSTPLILFAKSTPLGQSVSLPALVHASKKFGALDVVDKNFCEALAYSATSQNAALMEDLIQCGAQWLSIGQKRRCLFAELSNNQVLLKSALSLLKSSPEKFEAAFTHRDTSGMTCLEYGCKMSQIEYVRILLEHGARIENEDGVEFSCLSFAAQAPLEPKALELVQILLDNGANAAIKLKNGKIAAEMTNHSSVRTLLATKAGMDPSHLAPAASASGRILLKKTELDPSRSADRGARRITATLSAAEIQAMKEEAEEKSSHVFKFDASSQAASQAISSFGFSFPSTPSLPTPSTSSPMSQGTTSTPAHVTNASGPNQGFSFSFPSASSFAFPTSSQTPQSALSTPANKASASTEVPNTFTFAAPTPTPTSSSSTSSFSFNFDPSTVKFNPTTAPFEPKSKKERSKSFFPEDPK